MTTISANVLAADADREAGPSGRRPRALAFAVVTLLLLVVGLSLAFGTGAPQPRVSEWLTTEDGSSLLAAQPAVKPAASIPATSKGEVLRIDTGRRYQTFEGVGASLTDASASLIDTALTSQQRNALMTALFDPAKGAGLSYLRQPVGASDFSRSAYTYDDVATGATDPDLQSFSIARDQQYLLPLLRQAATLNPDLKVMGSPWTAPAWMRSGDSLSGLTGGGLLPRYTAAYAAYLTAFARAYAAAGVPIDTMSVQNEPLAPPAGHPGMALTAGQEAAVIRDLGPDLAAAKLPTRILASDQNWDLGSYALQVLSDPVAARYVAGVASHCYGGDPSDQSVLRTYAPAVDSYVTECSSGTWSTGFGDSLRWSAQNMLIGAARNGARATIYWNAALDQNGGPKIGGCADCRGLVTIDTRTRAVSYSPEYYALGQMSRAASVGAVRVDTPSPGPSGLQTVAFVNPDGSRGLLAFNPGGGPATTTVDDGHVSFPVTVPAGGLASYRWAGQRLSAATATPAPAVYVPTPAREARIRVMALGDSLVDGFVVGGGWRTELWHRLVQDDADPVVFVGSQSGGPTDLGDPRHEGHPGWQLDRLAGRAAGWVRQADPDVVLLMAGTNDLNNGATAAQALSRLDTLIRTVVAARPGVTVLVSTLVPMHNGHDSQWAAYNAGVPRVVAARRAAGAAVSVVDNAAVVPPNQYADGLHPDQAGYDALGDAWYRAVAPVVARLRAAAAPRLSASSVAVSACCTDATPSAAADGDLATRWTSGYLQEAGQWLQEDLGGARRVTGVDLDAGTNTGDGARGYEVLVSTDGSHWRTVGAVTDGGQRSGVRFAAATARYVRVRLTTGSPSNWWSVSELTVDTAPTDGTG